MNRTQNDVMTTDSLDHIKGNDSTDDLNSMDVAEDVAEDVDTAQPEATSIQQ